MLFSCTEVPHTQKFADREREDFFILKREATVKLLPLAR